METICHVSPEEKVKICSITINSKISPTLSIDLVNLEKPEVIYTTTIDCVTEDQIRLLVTSLLEERNITVRRTAEITF